MTTDEPKDRDDPKVEIERFWEEFDRRVDKALAVCSDAFDRELEESGVNKNNYSRRLERHDPYVTKRIVSQAVYMMTECIGELLDSPDGEDVDAGGRLLEKYYVWMDMDTDFLSDRQQTLLDDVHERLCDISEDNCDPENEERGGGLTPAQALVMLEKFIHALGQYFDEWFSDNAFAEVYVYPMNRDNPVEFERYGRLCRKAFPQAIRLLDGVLKDMRRDLCAQELTQAAQSKVAVEDKKENSPSTPAVTPLRSRKFT